jgi:predicted KAP-like P-loop ATPase
MKNNTTTNGTTKKWTHEKAYSVLLDIRFLISIAAISCFLFFKAPIEDALNHFLVSPILQHVKQIWYNDLLMFIITLLFGLHLNRINNFEKTKPKLKNEDIFFILIGLVYLGYRISNSTWDFIPTYFLPFIKYSDFYIIFLTLNFTIPRYKAGSSKDEKPHVKAKDEFFEDIELSPIDPDLLGYEPYAKQIADKIKKSTVTKSFAIGINAKWGQGKSSFINLIKKHVHSDEIIEVDFKPWFSKTSDSIIKDFFESFIDKIPSRNKSLTNLLKSYSDKLLSINNNSAIQIILTAFRDSEKEPVTKIYKEVNAQLVTLNKKTIIYIDDLDRLNKDEIIEVIKLIRNTANFVNTYYIVAYDRDYVVEALKNHTDFRRHEFLEKIFQLEVSLPGFKSRILREKLFENLKQHFSSSLLELFKDTIIGSKGIPVQNFEYLEDWLENVRDVTRISNSLTLNYKELEEDVDFGDFLKLELLRVKYPSVYHIISKRKNEFFETDSKGNGKFRYYLKKKNTQKSDDPVYDSFLKDYMTSDAKFHSLSEDDLKKIENLLASIFGFNKNTFLTFHNRSAESVIYPSKFDRYFAYKLSDTEISNKEFYTSLELPQDELNAKILFWVNKGMVSELLERFRDLNEFDSKEQYEKHIKAIFYLGNIKRITSDDKEDRVLFNPKELIEKLVPGGALKAEKYYDGDVDKLKEFVKGIFETAIPPYYFEVETLRYAKRYWMGSFILSPSEMDELTQDYFLKYTQKTRVLTSDVWHLYYCCENYEKDFTDSTSYQIQKIMPEKASEIMRDFVLKKDPETFVKHILQQYKIEEDLFTVIPEVKVMFGTWDNFYAEFEKIKDNNEVLLEFFEFVKKCKAVDFKEYVEFKFTHHT